MVPCWRKRKKSKGSAKKTGDIEKFNRLEKVANEIMIKQEERIKKLETASSLKVEHPSHDKTPVSKEKKP